MHLTCSVFWDAEEGIFVGILPCAETINSDLYIQTQKTLQKHFRWGQSHKNVVAILLQHDNVEPHTSLRAQEVITKLQWNTLAHPPHIPNFAPSDFWSPQRCLLWEKTWEWWWGYWGSEEVHDCEYNIHTVTGRGQVSCSLPALGCWSWWWLCRKIRCVIYLSY